MKTRNLVGMLHNILGEIVRVEAQAPKHGEIEEEIASMKYHTVAAIKAARKLRTNETNPKSSAG